MEPLGEFRPPPSLWRRTSRAPPRAPRNPRPRAPHVTAQRRTIGQWRASSLARPGLSQSVAARFPATAERRGGATTAFRARSTASSPPIPPLHTVHPAPREDSGMSLGKTSGEAEAHGRGAEPGGCGGRSIRWTEGGTDFKSPEKT